MVPVLISLFAHDMLTRTGHGNEVTVEPFHPEGKVESESRMRTRHFSEANEKLAKIWKTDPDNARQCDKGYFRFRFN